MKYEVYRQRTFALSQFSGFYSIKCPIFRPHFSISSSFAFVFYWTANTLYSAIFSYILCMQKADPNMYYLGYKFRLIYMEMKITDCLAHLLHAHKRRAEFDRKINLEDEKWQHTKPI